MAPEVSDLSTEHGGLSGLIVDRTAQERTHAYAVTDKLIVTSSMNTSVTWHGMKYEPVFCPSGTDPYTLVEWRTADAVLKDREGNVIYEQKGVEAPSAWSDRAIRIVAQKYFYGRLPGREHSVRQLIGRVVGKIRQWLEEQTYFCDATSLNAFCGDLTYLLLTQHCAFNSPVWFNLGVETRNQQVSACFINSVEDKMESIAALQSYETSIFRQGSGSGVNMSKLRGSMESLSGGGIASGPVSFMRGYDAWAGTIKSGGATRRAAKMVILNAGHPDVVEFINCKRDEEAKAQRLIAAGYSADFNDPKGAYASVHFQNANHSVRVNDAFMKRLEYALAHPDEEVKWALVSPRDNTTIISHVDIRDLWTQICEAAWACGDPGLQFDTVTNVWNTCSNSGRINASNPCSEFVFLDDSACNLASINLMKFRTSDGNFDTDKMQQVVRILITAMDGLVSKAYYPTKPIEENSHRFRPLGLGYANLGAYLMSIGQPYDSEKGRETAMAITSAMTAEAYKTSAKLAQVLGSFDGFTANRQPMLDVIRKHQKTAMRHELPSAATWTQALELGEAHGFRNAQVTLLAPTGTIGFLMDCETTGIEPEIGLYKVKKLVGGGDMVLENRIVDLALSHLGYDEGEIHLAKVYLEKHKTLEGCSILKEPHVPVFDCAVPVAGTRYLSLDAHLKMAAAVQPFLSGAISKTMNMPTSASVQDISQAFLKAWAWGIKSTTIYRDGCKQSQPYNSKEVKKNEEAHDTEEEAVPKAVRRRLNDHQTNAHRIKFRFGEVKGFLIVTPYEDTGLPGELFVEWSKEGSTVSGLVDGWATSISYNLQYGVPLQALVDKFAHTKFEPSGWSSDPDIRNASSIYDAIMRKLAAVFLNKRVANGNLADSIDVATAPKPVEEAVAEGPGNGHARFILDAPPCNVCGALMRRSGATCYSCDYCGSTTGCGG